MQLTKYGHSCLLVTDGDARVLIDPGVFSTGFEGLRGLTAVLITHQHADHLDIDRLATLLEANPTPNSSPTARARRSWGTGG